MMNVGTNMFRPYTFCLVMLALLTSGHSQQLQVVTETGKVLLELELADDPVWRVLWNHSVAGFLVTDYYRYAEGKMLLTATRTPDFAAGLGHIPGRGRLESDDEGGYFISGIDEPVPGNRYSLRVGTPRVNHRICHRDTCHSLSAVAARQRVIVRVVP